MSVSYDTKGGGAQKTHWWPVLALIAALVTFEAMGAFANQLGHDGLVDPAVTLSP